MTTRPSQSLYQLLVEKLQQAEQELAAADLAQLYEEAKIPGFEPKTIWEEEWGPKNSASKVPWGVKLERSKAAIEAKIEVLTVALQTWTDQEKAWHDEQPKVEPVEGES